jgi:hypothetical protein
VIELLAARLYTTAKRALQSAAQRYDLLSAYCELAESIESAA